MTIEYHPAVVKELEEIRNFYETRSPLLGKEFVDEFERLALQISANPGRWMVLEGDMRRALMPRFPYVIYFRQVASDRVRVLIVKHQRRHPSLGRNRE
jgi:toxin ParE1/3/4